MNLDALINSSLLVFAGEMGDKTQLLSIVLVARYKKPWTILLGVFVATLLNHAMAAWGGAWLASFVKPETLSWILALIFFAFAIWILIPDKEEELKPTGHLGVLATTIVTFFMAEMGDKTQLATVALAAKYSDVVMVTLGTTIGMMVSNALAVLLGHKLVEKISMLWVRRIASLLFLLFGLGILVGLKNSQ